MKVTVTGAAGRLGSQTVSLLWENGYEVHATDQNYRRDMPVRVQVASLLNRESCYQHLEGSDAVVHLGNHSTFHGTDRQRIYIENAAMNFNVFQAAAEVGVKRIVFASSIQVLGGVLPRGNSEPHNGFPPQFPLGGDTPARPDNPYGLSKETGERMLHYFSNTTGIATFAIRFPFLVNPDIRARIREHIGDRPDRGPGKSPRDAFSWLDTRDAAALIDVLLRSELSGCRVFMPSGPIVREESVPELSERFYPGVPWTTPPEKATSFFDVAAITEATGWKPAISDPLEDSSAHPG